MHATQRPRQDDKASLGWGVVEQTLQQNRLQKTTPQPHMEFNSTATEIMAKATFL